MPIQIQDSTGAKANASGGQITQIKTDLGLEQVNNTTDANKPVSTAQAAADAVVAAAAAAALTSGLAGKVDSSLLGANNGVATLDSAGTVPASQLPSYVDDVLEFANFGALPGTGVTGKIYVTLATNLQYRWSGSAYIQLVPSPGTTDALTEGSTNLYHTVARVRAVVLTGIDLATNAVVTATDTVMGAIGKLSARLEALVATVAGKATQSQVFGFEKGIVGALANGDYTIVLRSPNYAITITEWATKCGIGTCTATFKIGSTPFGGTANAVSTTLQTQAQASANVVAAGSTIIVTISANSSCADLVISARYTRTLS